MLILNDIHIGFNRKAGTTPASQDSLRTYLFGALEMLIAEERDPHLLIAGDLFDTFTVSTRDWIDTWLVLDRHMCSSPKAQLTLVAGNHDWSPKGDQVSSFEALCRILSAASYGQRVVVVGIDEFRLVENRVWALAHCSSQEVFMAKLKEVCNAEQKPKMLIVHANYDNKFASQSDHSLNIPREVAQNITDNGIKLVFAHEHQTRNDFGGKVYVMGNQWPTSIADCLNNTQKFAHLLKDDLTLERLITWAIDMPPGQFMQCDWSQLEDFGAEAANAFVRVTGSANAAQAGDVINAIAAFRRTSTAFVVSNAVEVDGIVQAEELPETFEVAKRFDVMSYIKQHLTPAEMEVVETLMKDEQ